ncbi:MAG: lytic murein transglycosylase [Candidatus Endonucleobacter sp. (ex Gigantidas childressi)]|nr:lytic murein transglycosylase [Candidatus Endonucleobacter sp. (ex Gigantidas childressi)]
MLIKHGKYIVSALITATALLQTPTGNATSFQKCINNLEQKALNIGVSKKTVTEALGPVTFIPKTMELDQRQPEFNETFAEYLNKRVTTFRIKQGQQLLKDHKVLLDKLTKTYGVPQHYLLAFWGLETNYGNYLGKFPIIDTLVTLACDERRGTYFTKEVIAAFQLMDKYNIPRANMLGSWAGAMGHTQFMPSAYLNYGVDGENNNTVNLWTSIPDAMTSAANFLKELGWQRSWKWGREILLPKNFDYLITGLNNKKTLTEWRKLGVKTAFGGPIPEGAAEAALIIPAGYKGPAFLVYDNFNVIMGWNRSIKYAISVGYLADRIKGSQELVQAPPANALRLNTDQVKALQMKLNQLGFDAGKPDGMIGSMTKKAVALYQRSQKLIADGYPRLNVFKSLNIALNLGNE